MRLGLAAETGVGSEKNHRTGSGALPSASCACAFTGTQLTCLSKYDQDRVKMWSDTCQALSEWKAKVLQDSHESSRFESPVGSLLKRLCLWQTPADLCAALNISGVHCSTFPCEHLTFGNFVACFCLRKASAVIAHRRNLFSRTWLQCFQPRDEAKVSSNYSLLCLENEPVIQQTMYMFR